MENASQIILGPAAFYTGVAGQEATTHMGYFDEEGLQTGIEIEKLDVKSGNKIGKVKTFVIEATAKFSGTLLQATLANMAKMIPGAVLTADGKELYIPTENAVMQECSAKIVGINPETGGPREIKIPYCNPAGSWTGKMSAREVQNVPFELESLSQGSKVVQIIDDFSDATVTLVSGKFTRTKGQTFYRVAGEGGAADALTDIEGGAGDEALVDNELIILAIADAADAITVTHGAGILEATGAANWAMDNLKDLLFLRYDLDNTKWVEVGRDDARSDV